MGNPGLIPTGNWEPETMNVESRLVKLLTYYLQFKLLHVEGTIRYFSITAGLFGPVSFSLKTRRKVVPEKIANVPEVVAIACGWYHCMLLDVDGSVWVFGKNDHLQLGLERKELQTVPTKLTNLPKIQQICGGRYHSTFVD